jgi:hypothetical protein
MPRLLTRNLGVLREATVTVTPAVAESTGQAADLIARGESPTDAFRAGLEVSTGREISTSIANSQSAIEWSTRQPHRCHKMGKD